MNRGSFIRKIIYVLCIGMLLIPLSYYSQPDVIGPGNEMTGGGKLAQLRREHNISESSLGEIDPTGETIKLATLGFRGVAANLLWHKADMAKMKEDWDGLQSTLDQIAKLEPHYISVWDYQGWNVSYNISVEWDDYHDRYFWVKEGAKFLLRGFRYNDRQPMLLYRVGWTTAQKMGTADEKVQYRRLFREDDDEEFPNHRLRPQNRRDNWLVGKEYFEQAIALVENKGASIRRQNPLVFYSEPAMCQIDYAIALEDDGIFEEKGKFAWTDADTDWTQFGQRAIPTTWGIEIRLSDQESFKQQADELITQLESLSPGLREKMMEERRAKLTESERELLDTPPEKLSQDDMSAFFKAKTSLNVPLNELAERVEEPLRDKAKRLADDASRLEETAGIIHREREIVNFRYWRLRCQAEKTDAALEARRLIYEGKRLYDDAQLEEALEAYNQAFAKWRQVVDEFPEIRDDPIGGTSIEEAIKGYFDVLRQIGAPFPKDFPLTDVVRAILRRSLLPIPPEFMDEIAPPDANLPQPDPDAKSAETPAGNQSSSESPPAKEK
jgi:hypothetical protein